MMMRDRWLRLSCLVVFASLVFAACGGDSSDDTAAPTTTQPEATTTTAAPAMDEAVMDEAEMDEAEMDMDYPTAESLEGYKAVARPAQERWTIGYGDGLSGIPFTDSVTDSINEVAEAMGVDIVYCDNAYDQEKTLQCAELIVSQGADGVIFANWIAGTEELITGVFLDAGLSCVAYDGPHPGCVAFGPDNYEASAEAGRFLGRFAMDQGWDPAETELIVLWTPGVQVMQDRRDGSIAGVKEIFDIPDENIHTDIPHETFEDVLSNVTSWVTANPGAQNVLCFGHSDQPGVDCALALEQGGFLGRAASASLGASTEALVDLRTRTDEESIFKATISYFPERYGEYLVPIVVDMLEGRGGDVPERIIPAVAPVTRANVMELYPPEGMDEAETEMEMDYPTAESLEGYEAVARPAQERWTIGYGDGLSGIPFTDSVTDSINEVAEAMGVDIVYCDNAYDQEKTLQCAELIVSQGADGVIFANWIAGTEELITGVFLDAGLSCVAYDGPHPGCVAFGPDNYEASAEAGRFLGRFAMDQGWDPAETELIVLWTPGVQVMQDRRDGSIAGVKEIFDIPDENIHTDIPHETFEDVLSNVTSWVTANPGAQNVLCFGHSDQPGVDCALALEQGGFLGRAASASLGASTEALVDLRTRTDEESIFKATISFFPERYGEYLVPMMVDRLEGREVPDHVSPAVEPVTRANVMELYPG